MQEKLTIALPTRNEALSIEDIILRIREAGMDVFVVDSHSTDNTVAIAESHGVEVYQRDEYGSGYGCAILKALEVASKKNIRYLGMIDCDSTYFPEDFKDFDWQAGEYDLIVGARPMELIEFWHRMANMLHSGMTSLVYGRKVKDVNSGMRILHVNKFYTHLTATNFGLVAQMTSFALRNRLKFIEIPIRFSERLGESKIRIWDAIFICYRIVSERFKKRVH